MQKIFDQDTWFLLGKCFFLLQIYFFMKNLTDFRKTVETGEDPAPALEQSNHRNKKWHAMNTSPGRL